MSIYRNLLEQSNLFRLIFNRSSTLTSLQKPRYSKLPQHRTDGQKMYSVLTQFQAAKGSTPIGMFDILSVMALS